VLLRWPENGKPHSPLLALKKLDAKISAVFESFVYRIAANCTLSKLARSGCIWNPWMRPEQRKHTKASARPGCVLICSRLNLQLKVSQRDLQCSALLGILQTGDKEPAVTNSSEGRVLERFHHLLPLLIVD